MLIAVADCTGHGVPGAMVSVVCNNALNRALNDFKLLTTTIIERKDSDNMHTTKLLVRLQVYPAPLIHNVLSLCLDEPFESCLHNLFCKPPSNATHVILMTGR